MSNQDGQLPSGPVSGSAFGQSTPRIFRLEKGPVGAPSITTSGRIWPVVIA